MRAKRNNVASLQYENQKSLRICNWDIKNRNDDSFGMQDTVVSETASEHGLNLFSNVDHS